jgi:hypothetical protein
LAHDFDKRQLCDDGSDGLVNSGFVCGGWGHGGGGNCSCCSVQNLSNHC